MTKSSSGLGEVLKAAGVKQLELAKAVGARPETVSRWVRGHQIPAGETIGLLLLFVNRPSTLRKLGRRRPLTFGELFGSAA
jgi:transcriptional regulator with XRE-family HTH domain